jgi:hypothetical protein
MLLFLLACGGGPGSFNGTVQNHKLTVQSALLVANSEVWLSDAKELCPKLQKNQLPKLGTIVKLAIRPIGTGEFTVQPSLSTGTDRTATASFLKLNGECGNTVQFQGSFGKTGKLTVDRYDASKSIDGTFDLTFGDTDAVKGSFSATYCDAATSYPAPECVDAL